MSISESEILDAIREAAKRPDIRPDGAFSSTELSNALGLSKDTVQRILVTLVKSGQMACVWITTPDITGRPNRIPVYRLIAPPKKKAKR